MAKIAVIIRHLPNNRPITLGIEKVPADYGIDNVINYLFGKAKERIDRFKREFPEFRTATWYVDIIDDDEGKILYETYIIKPEN